VLHIAWYAGTNILGELEFMTFNFSFSNLKMEVAGYFETLIPVYQIARCYIPEVCNLIGTDLFICCVSFDMPLFFILN
jgi:hypothetical protein